MVQDIEEFTGTYPEAEYMSVADYAIDVANTLKENVDQYEEDEQIRQSQESTRQTEENERETQESIRKNEENVRRISELERRENEEARRTAENARVAAENARRTAESARASADNTRQLNEGERIANEEDRIELYNDIKEDYESGAFKGDRGDSGVYIGSGEMPSDCNVQIDPNGTIFNPAASDHIIDGVDSVTIDVDLDVNGDITTDGNVTCDSLNIEGGDLNVNGNTYLGNTFIGDDDINDLFDAKQNALTAGSGIDISNDTISSINMIEMTRAQILTLSRNKKLKKGMLYRITDYSLNDIQYDIVIMAESDSKFNENARAIRHEGDTYFSGSKLSAWQLKYCISQDSDRFAWASDCPIGVVYWMKDEFGNEAPYDFKAIKFTRTLDDSGNYSESGTGTSVFTFNNFSKETTICSDASLTGKCRDNVIKPYVVSGKMTLNNNVFLVNGLDCVGATILEDSRNNTLYGGGKKIGIGCYNNVVRGTCELGDGCYNNTVSGTDVVLGWNCTDCKIGGTGTRLGAQCEKIECTSGYGNTFGTSCSRIKLGAYCSENTFGHACGYLTFGSNCRYNTFGNYIYGKNMYTPSTFADYFSHNYIGDECQYICVSKSYVRHCIFEGHIGNIVLTSSMTTSQTKPIRYLHFNSGCNEYDSDSTPITVSVGATSQTFKTVYGKAADNKINI